MTHRRTTLLLLALVPLLAGCGEEARPRPPAAAVAAKLPPRREVELRLFSAFRAGLRALSIATAVAGESGDIGQPVPAGIVDRVSCRTAARCVVRWSDVRGGRHRSSYDMTGAARGCFEATANPGLDAIFDHATNSSSIHPLQQLSGGLERC